MTDEEWLSILAVEQTERWVAVPFLIRDYGPVSTPEEL